MIRPFLRLTRVSLLASLLIPLVVSLCSRVMAGTASSGRLMVLIGAGLVGIGVLDAIVARFFGHTEVAIERVSVEQARYLDELPERWVSLAIVCSAALSLFLELSMIRWQGSVWEFFAFYKNFGLLACFAGLGLGYALARRNQIPLFLSVPLIALQMLLFIGLRYGLRGALTDSLRVTPIREQIDMGLGVASRVPQYVALYAFLMVVLLLTALAFLPIGQLCGRLLSRTGQLRGYGLNLLGSLAGVVMMFGVSYLWTPPVIWFGLAFAAVLIFLAYDRRVLLIGILSTISAMVILAWPVSFRYEMIYSPYQLLERGYGDRGMMMIRAAGHYFQRVHDLSVVAQAERPELKRLADYYELAYLIHPAAADVAIVGAGSGNDVAAALRRGAGHVDAIEIDPAILALGAVYHPEAPYSDIRVRRIVDDARSFLRNSTSRYDLVVYGLLDSHTLLSHASSVRLDSFVYTVEGLRSGRDRLKDDGVLSLAFSVMSDEIGRKIYLMMTQAFDGHPPVCVRTVYDASVSCFQSKNGGLVIPTGLLASSGFENVTALYANAAIKADVSTDDWPFFYMPQRVYPVSYIYMIALVLIVSAFLFFTFIPGRPHFSNSSFFLLGAGFMLVETKSITELGLTFGNTWQVIGVVIAGILMMAFLANLLVQRLSIGNPQLPYVLLIMSLAAGWWVSRTGGFPPSPSGRLATVFILTCPMFFSGLVFSSLLLRVTDISSALATNLMGAMLGGMLEYNSMYFGFRFLYLLALGLYVSAMFATLGLKNR